METVITKYITARTVTSISQGTSVNVFTSRKKELRMNYICKTKHIAPPRNRPGTSLNGTVLST